MSFILDALKKSEIERQRQAIPGLMDSRPPPPRSRFPLWALALVALLAVNLAVLAIVVVRSGAASTRASREVEAASAVPRAAAAPWSATSPAAAAAPPAASAPATARPSAAASPPAPAADHFSPMDGAPEYAPEIPTVPPAAGPPAAASGYPRTYPAVPRHPPRLPDPVLSQEDDKSSTEVLPSINEINLVGQQALPPLHLDVHVYATNPADRFVYINMQKYREGATLAEGPVLERIRRDGVVLNYNGLRFVLPRQ